MLVRRACRFPSPECNRSFKNTNVFLDTEAWPRHDVSMSLQLLGCDVQTALALAGAELSRDHTSWREVHASPRERLDVINQTYVHAANVAPNMTHSIISLEPYNAATVDLVARRVRRLRLCTESDLVAATKRTAGCWCTAGTCGTAPETPTTTYCVPICHSHMFGGWASAAATQPWEQTRRICTGQVPSAMPPTPQPPSPASLPGCTSYCVCCVTVTAAATTEMPCHRLSRLHEELASSGRVPASGGRTILHDCTTAVSSRGHTRDYTAIQLYRCRACAAALAVCISPLPSSAVGWTCVSISERQAAWGTRGRDQSDTDRITEAAGGCGGPGWGSHGLCKALMAGVTI